MIQALVAGLTIGIGSGAAPGPLMGLAITTTMRSGLAAGMRIAIAPLFSDAIIIGLSLTLVAQLPNVGIQILGVIGAIVVAFFGVETLLSARKALPPMSADEVIHRKHLDRYPVLLQGALINLLNPAPWIFWVTAGSTLLVNFWRENPASAVGFLITFYLMLIGVKVVLVVALAATRHRMSTKTYRAILVGSGLLLLVAAVILLATHVL
ncbi:MAG: LysE family transporter [Candidatus Nanopelagicales bacterium]